MKKLISTLLIITIFSTMFSVHSFSFNVGAVMYPANETHTIVDVPRNCWYYPAFVFCHDHNLMTPTVIKTEIDPYGPHYYTEMFYGDRNITRAEIVTILSRYNWSRRLPSTAPAFVDVPDGLWYTGNAQWAYDNGIVNGVGGAYFAPERTITREEFAAMLYRYTNYLEVDTSARADFSAFADSDSVSSWATDAMSWAVAEGLISGKPGNLLAPQDTITRAEVAVIIYRFNNEVKAFWDLRDGK